MVNESPVPLPPGSPPRSSALDPASGPSPHPPQAAAAEPGSRERILAAARAEFAEKGFDGARVDEIARRAEVNKALIYYYFKSKDELLRELLRHFFEERRALRTAGIADDPEARDLPDRFAAFEIGNLLENRDLVRIALMEDLKAARPGGAGGAIVEEWLRGLAAARAFHAERGYAFRFTPRVVTALFFEHLFPAIGFATLGEELAQAVGADFETLRREFHQLALETKRNHHHTVFGASNRDPAPEVRVPGVPAAQEPASRPARPQAHLELSPAEKEALVRKHFSNGRLVKFPLREKGKVAVLEHVSSLFEPGRTYTEKQVNAVLEPVAEDYVKIRRYLIEYGYLGRKGDCSAYWVWS